MPCLYAAARQPRRGSDTVRGNHQRMDGERSRFLHECRHFVSECTRLRSDQFRHRLEGREQRASGGRWQPPDRPRRRLSLAGGIVDPGLHGWKVDALHYKVLETIP